ncbi:MAG: hypothetical protein M3220_08795 [Chloroflexota bacterium]|nr:hypothetical protein [Chloroflexota bacterium]
MLERALDRVEVARLLRELAAELLEAEGAERNGLFLELHRLQDTIFRLALESHPDAPPTLAAKAFAVVDALPAPQVVRELYALDSQLVTPEIRNLYKHMNVARNNMAHSAALARVIVSRNNSKRMARLARLLAEQLDPAHEGMSEQEEIFQLVEEPRVRNSCALIWLVGLGVGVTLGWAWWERGDNCLGGLLLLLIAIGTSVLLFLDWRDW